MKYLVLAVLLASAYAAEETVEIAEAQMPFYPGGMMPWQGQNQYNAQGFQVDYSMGCSSSSSCGCAQRCIPMMPCPCRCPPPCPPSTTVTPERDPVQCPTQRCPNNAAQMPHCCANGVNNRYCCLNNANNAWCCVNGASNAFCCLNGANNQHCCTNNADNQYCCTNGVTDNVFCCENGAQNPECELPRTPPGDDCNTSNNCCVPCTPCRPCQVWWQCQPCQGNCQNGCQQRG